MRIGAGQFGGRVLRTPKGEVTRPTSGLVRETLFNILAHDVPDARMLDLYAGCGSVGLEALSRGAAQAVLVEKERSALLCLRENIAALGVEAQAEVISAPVERAVPQLIARGEQFGIIFLDPPFADLAAYRQVLEHAASLLAPDGMLIAQHDARTVLPAPCGSLTRVRVQRLGDNALSFYATE